MQQREQSIVLIKLLAKLLKKLLKKLLEKALTKLPEQALTQNGSMTKREYQAERHWLSRKA
jgi:hypothetical protein